MTHEARFVDIRILAIDDNRDNLTTLEAVVRDALPGCALLTAQSGPEGLELARTQDPDVILLDIVMPGIDGFEVCRRLKADERLRLIPVVFLTALKTDREGRLKALEAGAEAFLSKPLDEQELVAQVRAMAKLKAANRLQRLEKEQLAALVAERTRELEEQLAERQRMEAELREGLDRAERSRRAVLSTLEDQKRTEEHLRRQTAVTAAINRVLQESLHAETDTDVVRIGLSEAKALTGSPVGWIGEVNAAGRLDTMAVSAPGWESWGASATQMATTKGMEIRGLAGRVLKDGKSLITNEPGAHPDRVGLPSGHPDVTAYLGVPLKQEGRTIGMVALGNNPSGYALHDQEAIEALSVALVEALQRKRAEAKLAEQLDELRRWHSAVTGREGRVLEVKKEVNDLLAQRGQPPRYPSAVEEA